MEQPDAIPNPTKRWRLLVIDDHALCCAGMAMMFRTVPEVTDVAVATQPAQAVRIAALFRPDVVLLDATMPACDAFETARRLLASRAGCRVVFLDDSVRPRHVHAALRVGGSGYWTKHATFDEIVGAVRRAIDGKTTFCPEVERHLIETPNGLQLLPSLAGTPLANLTPRELEVLIYLTDGLTLKQCAERTNLSPGEVSIHKSRLMRKLDVRNVIDLVKLAAREGLTGADARGPALES